MKRMLLKDALRTAALGAEITVGGWVRTARRSKGGFGFVALNDGSCMKTLQVVADEGLPNYEDVMAALMPGSSVTVRGKLVASAGKGQERELQATELRLVGASDREQYPIQPKRHTFEFLRKQAHFRARTNTFGAVARVRNAVCMAIHEFFQSRGFVYVHTPIITASDCEGAGEMFRVRGADAAAGPAEEFFGRPAFLTVSGQLEAETYACALGNVYTFGPTFRSENSNTPRHLAEFWMVEPEMAFCDLAGNAEVAEECLKAILRAVLERCPEETAFFNQRVDDTLVDTLGRIVASDFVRLTYTEAVAILKNAGREWEYPVSWGANLQTEHERYLTEKRFGKPVIVTDYPAAIKPFYMRVNDDGKTVAAMDVLVPRIGEIIGGSQREERLDMLTRRMEGMGMPVADYWWYLDLRRYGTVPHAGFGLGLARAVQLCTGMENIRDVIPYPRTPRNAEF